MEDHWTEGSELSEVAAQHRWTGQLSGRWQIPLLVVSMAALALGIWRMRPVPKPPTFEQLYSHAVGLRDAGLLSEASTYIESLLQAPDRPPAELSRLHRLLAEVIYAHERSNLVHGKSNSERILEHTARSLEYQGAADAALYEMRGVALEWLRRGTEAVEEYRKAIQAGSGPHAWELRKRVIDIRQASGPLPPAELIAEWDAFIAAPDASDALRYWAIENRIEQFESEGQHETAEQFLRAHADILKDPAYRKAFDYLQTLCWFYVGRLDDAERQLRSLRDTLVPGHMLYARTGWLLGRVLARQESPEPALAMFDDVIASTVPGPYRTAAWLGRAECLALLERFDESAAAYNETLRLLTNEPYDSVVDLQVVRESTTALYQRMLTEGRSAQAMGYLRVASRLVAPSDSRNQALYAERLGDLAASLGRAELDRLKTGPGDSLEARQLFIEAAEEYLRLAGLVLLDDEALGSAVWRAADCLDLAGLRSRTQEVLAQFVQEQPASMRTPMALLRLGQTCQAAGQFAQAIKWYQQNIEEFPRTPSAVASLVPLSECFRTLGRTDLAEATLLRIVIRHPDDPMSLITPAALEYRDALFALGSLYVGIRQYEKAIARYEEALERYPDDPRSDQGAYLLADAFRHSAEQLREESEQDGNLAIREDLLATRRDRLERTQALYGRVIERYQRRAESTLGELDRLYVRLSHFYRADAVFDLARASDPPDWRRLAEAVDLYERASWMYQREPMSMSAYVQLIDCHLLLGNVEKARMALQRARWTLRGIPDDAFVRHAPSEDRGFWEEYLTWLERTPTLALDVAAAPATRPGETG